MHELPAKAAAIGLISLTLAAIRKDVHFEVPSSGYRFDAADGGVRSDEVTHNTYFVFRGHAVASSKDMVFRADAIKGHFATPKGSNKAYLENASSSGAATVTHTVKSAKSLETTVLQGSHFVFEGDPNVGHLQISGPVHITDGGSGKSDLHMTGNDGTAEFDMKEQTAKNSLRNATLKGNVVVDIVQFGQNSGSIHATGDHLVLDDTVTPHTLVLSGNVSMHGEGKSDFGSATGMQKVKFLLNRQGQFTHVSAGEAPN